MTEWLGFLLLLNPKEFFAVYVEEGGKGFLPSLKNELPACHEAREETSVHFQCGRRSLRSFVFPFVGSYVICFLLERREAVIISLGFIIMK